MKNSISPEALEPEGSRPPYFLFYANDFLSGTIAMTAEEVGAYLRLLCHQWSKGGLPNDPAKLSCIAGCNVPAYVLEKFRLGEDGLWRNARMERDRSKVKANSQVQSLNGKKGGRPKGSKSRNKTQSNLAGQALLRKVPTPAAIWADRSQPREREVE